MKTAKNRKVKSSVVIPTFDSEDQEEKWLWRHRRQLEAETARRIEEGTAYRKLPKRKRIA
ncbi:MAG TPA: hypothetical protein VMT20_11515 [Terriglobia bacterium]|nr:hypothetical protein [Terriglobia bacterium]